MNQKELITKLTTYLNLPDWFKNNVNTTGNIQIVTKPAPKGKSRKALSLEIDGTVKGRRGKYFDNVKTFVDFLTVMNDNSETIVKLLKAIENVNGYKSKDDMDTPEPETLDI